MKFNSSARFNRKSFNSEKLFDMGIHSGGTVNNVVGGELTELIINGGFETGDLTGWTDSATNSGYVQISALALYRHTGSYGCILISDAAYNGEEETVQITQDIDISGYGSLNFWFKSIFMNGAPAGVSNYFKVFLDGTEIYEETTQKTSWTYVSIDVSAYSGVYTLKFIFRCYNNSGAGWYGIQGVLDDISLIITSEPPFNVVTTEFQFTHEKTIEQTPALTYELIPANITATIENSPEEWCSVFIDTTRVLRILFYGGNAPITIGDTITGNSSGATAKVSYNGLYSGSFVGGDATGFLDLIDIIGLFTDGELISGALAGPNVAHIGVKSSGDSVVINFSSGSSEITIGEILNFVTSGEDGTVISIEVTSGSWVGGDAAGVIVVDDLTGEVIPGEDITGSGGGVAVVGSTPPQAHITPIIIEKSCWKSIDEVYWQASVLLDGLYAFSDVAGFKELYIDMPDHTATSQRVFYGFIPNQGIVQNPGDNTTRLTAYSHAFNLANQFIPDEYRDTVEWVPSGVSGYVTFSDPSVPITAFLGGALWNLTTGIQPQNILTITDWGTSTIPIRGFAWGPEVNKWQAIQEMADYCGYVFEVLYDSSLEHAVAEFCAVDDIDTYVGTPAAVTFDKDDAAKYVLNVSKERRGIEMINRVRVQGRRNKRILNFVDGITEFTAGHTVLDGLTGAEATIVSCTLSSGAWGGTAEGYLIISYDRTGDFVHDSTIIDTLGAAFGEATMQGNSVIYETYDEYTYLVESAAVTNLEERPRERFFALEEEYDSTPLIEAKCQAYYDMYALDPTPYNVTFRDRCDLRLWQKVKLTSFTEIPEDWMRIVSIRYTQRSGGAVDVSCTLNNADYVIAQRKMRRSLKNNDVTEIEKIVKAILAKKEVKVAEALKVQGEGITVELQDGERIVVGRAPE